MSAPEMSRRSLLRGAGVAATGGVAGYVVTAASGAADATSSGTAANDYGPPDSSSSTALASLDEVPAGGGLVLPDEAVVLVRDEGDAVRAFSATCTHQGCLVTKVTGGQILCPCHGSAFDATTGEVAAGPATSPLDNVEVTVRDGAVFPS